MTQFPPNFTAANLLPGQVYRVKAAFIDYDGSVHHIGETWRFVSKSFLPYEDGLTLTVVQDGRQELIRLQWRPEAQAEIIEGFSGYVEAIDSTPAQPAKPPAKRSRLIWIILVIGVLIMAIFVCLALVGALMYFLNAIAYFPSTISVDTACIPAAFALPAACV